MRFTHYCELYGLDKSSPHYLLNRAGSWLRIFNGAGNTRGLTRQPLHYADYRGRGALLPCKQPTPTQLISRCKSRQSRWPQSFPHRLRHTSQHRNLRRVCNVGAVAGIILGCVLSGIFPILSLIALAPMLLALFSFSGARKFGDTIGKHPQYLGANVAATLLTPLALGVSLIA